MKKLLLFLLTILLVTSLACITTQPELITKINQIRQDSNLNTLNQEDRLNDFAQYRFSKLEPPYLSHTNFRKDYSNFMGNEGYLEKGTIADCGEIIEKLYDYKAKFYNIDMNDLIGAWLNSQSHREVILNETFENIGCYIGYKDQYTIIIVVEFDTLY
jgi:uncharacterized protein YkwD